MGFAGQTVVDAFILAGATSLSVVGCLYIAMMWRLRGNFFLVLRSPLLACAFGIGITLRYIVSTYEDLLIWDEDEGTVDSDGVIDLFEFPILVAVQIALVMTAVRLLVMYYPKKRARWGRYMKEKLLVRALGAALVVMEVAVWSAAYGKGVARTATWVSTARPLSVVVTIVAAVTLACQLRHVHDSTSLSRDIGMVGRVLAAMFFVYAAVELIPMRPLAYKYAHIVFLALVHPPLVYLIIARPVREVLRPAPVHRRSCFEALLAPRHGRAPTTAGEVEQPATFVGSNRLATIMSLPPLRKAFGEFCRKSLCSESFEFLVDVAKFKAFDRSAGGSGDEVSFGFARFLDIVNTYIRYDSHSEVNIGSDIKRGIMDYSKCEAYLMLGPKGRQKIFDAAEVEISQLLADNLLRKFFASAEYTEVVDLENQ